MADAPSPHSLLSRLIAETFGTFMLVIGVIGAALFISAKTGPLGVALAVGIAVLTAAYAVGHISGGHFNPAVSIGAAAAGRMPWRDVLPYIGAQLVGGILATLALGLVALTSGGKFTADFAAVSNGYDGSFFGLGAVIITEIVVTCLFLWIILGVTAPNAHVTAGFAPLAIGLALTLFHLIAIPVDNASLNPARSIATAILGGTTPLSQLWVFIVAPIVGALIAGFTWKALFGRSVRA
ncbi:MAG TPA: aquaporin [Pseudolysinimonas sp.]|jgi:aquaporin Z